MIPDPGEAVTVSNATPIIRQAGEGERLWFAGGGVVTFKAPVAETGGSFSLMEDTMARGKTTPLHLHPDADEVIYLVEGEILAHVDGSEHAVREGGLLVAPRGVPHAFLVTSATARAIVMLVPGPAGEAFFRAASEPLTAENESSPPDIARLQAVAAESPSIEILGPPPFAALVEATTSVA
jgi:quercetin dioxygenase-like cupin family protein